MVKAVFLPGKLCDQRIWAQVMDALSDIISPFFIDLSEAESMDEMLLRLSKSIDEEVILIGFSMGGYIAQEFILKHPQRIKALIIVGSSAEGYNQEELKHQRKVLQYATKFTGLSDASVRQFIHPARYQDFELINLIKDMANNFGKDGFVRQQSATLHRVPRLDDLKRINCPALVISGDVDNIVPVQYTSNIAKVIPGATYYKVKNAGHMVPLEQPEELIEVIRIWLSKIL